MTADAWIFSAAAVVVTAAWLAAYRLPFADPRLRQRLRLRATSTLGLPAKYVFPLFGTLIYLALGSAAAFAMMRLGGLSILDLLAWHVTPSGAATAVLAAIGASALTAFAMSMLYAVRPRIDVPGAVTGVRWIQEILVLPRHWRWIVPMVSAAVEEFFFRGVLLLGLLAAGAPVWVAIVLPGLIFVAGQIALTERRLQAVVLGISSVVLSVVCGLLTVLESSVLPAILIHASFAGYYTNTSASRASVPVHLPG